MHETAWEVFLRCDWVRRRFAKRGGPSTHQRQEMGLTTNFSRFLQDEISVNVLDLPRRPREGFSLTPYNRATFYGGEEKGYTDYPVYGELERAE